MSFFRFLRMTPKLVRCIDALEQIVPRLEAVTPKIRPTANESILRAEIDRLKLSADFARVASRAAELEQKWQRIQQDENNADFAFQISQRRDDELQWIYKKGFAEGIKWCLKESA